MSKKAAKKATKPQSVSKGPSAPKDGAKKPAKDKANRDGRGEGSAESNSNKPAKRRVTISVSAEDAGPGRVTSGDGETANGETQRDRAGKTGTKEQKRAPRIIAVPSTNSVERGSPKGDSAADFANSPFAGDLNESADEAVAGEPGAHGKATAGKKKTGAKASKPDPRPATGKRGVKDAKPAAAEAREGRGKATKAKHAQADAAQSPDDAKTKQKAESEAKGDAKRKAGSKKERGSAKGEPRVAETSEERASQRAEDKSAKRARAKATSDEAAPPSPKVKTKSKTKAGNAKEKDSEQPPRNDAEEPSTQATSVPEGGDAPSPDGGKSRSRRGGKAERSAQLPNPTDGEPSSPVEQTETISEDGTGDDEEDEDDSVLEISAEVDEEDDGEQLSEEEENRRYLKGIIEALLFASDKPLTGRELARAARIDKKRTLQLLVELRKEYKHRGVNIVEVSGGYVLRSNPLYGAFVQKALALRPVKLSRAQLETLAIIAYRQPITRPEIDDIRGVDSGQVLKGLADRDLIKMLGKKDEAGRPMLYGTTQAFLELFSLDSLKGLPSLREFTELSEDSREKFASVTGETIPGPTVLGEEGADLGEPNSDDESLGDDEPAAADASLDAELESPATSGDAGLDDEASPEVSPLSEYAAEVNDVAASGGYEADGDSTLEDSGDAFGAESGVEPEPASGPEWGTPSEPDFSDDEPR